MNDTLLAQAQQRLRRLAPLEPWLYGSWAAALTLICACRFYSSMRLQTTFADLFHDPSGLEAATRGALGPWSAPLDDVFIHFDFARQAARGHPFEWSPGAGYSSGGTSLLYPFVLVPGFWLGLGGLNLMQWAATVACICVFGSMLALRRLFRELPLGTSYLLPPALLSVGVLDWSLWSGMEVALFLGVWSLAVIAWDDLRQATARGRSALYRPSAALAAAGFLMCSTRPEAIGALGVLAVTALWDVRRAPLSKLASWLAIVLVPALALLVAHGVANRLLTADSSAAGAIVKLELHHPYMDKWTVIERWVHFFLWQLDTITHHHLAATWYLGYTLWLLAAYALWPAQTRRPAVMLWLSMLSWLCIVSLNGQVAWQNTRYAMPTVACLLCAAALGLGAALGQARLARPATLRPAAVALVLAGVFVWQQGPRFTDQLWFFGRASRNILDQHVRTARYLRDDLQPRPHRVLVGDAGAIPYISDLPALDIIGLGGFRGMPFARATRQNVAAGIELIERLKPSERPDVLAIYPSWWGDFPLWFGKRLGEVPARGNVICGAAAKVLYRPRWELLDRSEQPFSLKPGERRVDGLDMADLISERAHGYALSNRSPGHVAMKLLANPLLPREDLWDAGRIVPPGVGETFKLSGIDPEHPVTLLVRAAPTEATELVVSLAGGATHRAQLPKKDGWLEQRIELGRVHASHIDVRFDVANVERIFYHVWAVQPE